MRDEFSQSVKKTVAARSGCRCSNPNCFKITSGPKVNPERALNIGVAAHITAASPGGARYDDSATINQRSSIGNAIWLCQSCSTLIDRDPDQFTIEILQDWKLQAENAAAAELAAISKFRTIELNELRQELTIAELVALRSGGTATPLAALHGAVPARQRGRLVGEAAQPEGALLVAAARPTNS